MTLDKVCLLLKTMQYLVTLAYKKDFCDDICPVYCKPHRVPGHGHGHGHGYGYGGHGGHGHGHWTGLGFRTAAGDGDTSTETSLPPRPDNLDLESLARAMGIPNDTFTKLVDDELLERPKINTTTKPKQRPRPPINKDAVQFADDKDYEGFTFGYNEERCFTPDSRRGSCLNIRRCQPLLQLLTNYRSDPGVISYLRASVCGFENNDPVVCCPDNDSNETPSNPSPGNYRLPTLDEGCGRNNESLSRRVVNGVPAALGTYPWIGVLGYRSQRTPGKTLWQCGGTLITSRHVITAAHCIHGHEDDLYLVRLGELDLERDDEGATPIDVPIEKQIKHEEYSPSKYVNDIAILKLSYDVPFTDLIKPICLPMNPELRTNSFERSSPFIAGWGSTSFRGPSASHLQELQIPTVSNEQCKKAYSSFKQQVIDQRVLCAGYARGGKDACQGDSGGPLMWPSIPPGRDYIYYYLIGVVSYGYKCAEPGYPGVYTRVTEFIPWIQKQINV